MTAAVAGAAPAPRPSVISGFFPIIRGLVFAVIGFAIGAGLAMLIRMATGAPAWAPTETSRVGTIPSTEQIVTLGFVFAVPGWLLGVGFLETTVRQWFGYETKPVVTDWRRYLTTCEDHKVIGLQYLATFVVVLLVAGLGAMTMRFQLMQPSGPLPPDVYNRIMSFHGIAMVSVAVAAVMGSFGNYFVPIMIGARDMAYPRLNALSYWLIPVVIVSLFLSEFLGGWDSGWTSYPPLSVRNAAGQIMFNLAIITFGLSSILGGINFLVTTIKMRAPGMTWGRVPIFVWSVFSAAWLASFFTQFFAASLLMVLLDRIVGTGFFVGQGGAPLLYEHTFWFYSHPAVYIFVLPGFGMALEVLAHMSRKPLFAYRWAVAAFIGIVGLSGIVWAHHMFVSGMPSALLGPFLVTTELISIPTGLIFLSALGTIWMGRLWLTTPMLFALGFVFNFLIGGVTGIFLADVPTDVSLHDTYFVVAHFHYTIIGGEIFALFAAFYFWFPKMTGRMLSERLGKLNFWMMFIFFNTTFLPMFWAGLHGMNRRIATYQNDLATVNLFISINAFLLGSSFLVFVVNVLRALLSKRAPRAEANPWRARTLEWLVSSPPPVENFPSTPIVVGSPYGYGTGGRPHAVFGLAGASDEEVPA